MRNPIKTSIGRATPQDGPALAKLIDIAGEGIPSWLWAQSAKPSQSPLDVGITRAQRKTGGFSYKNAKVARCEGIVAGMVLSYPIERPPEDAPDGVPAAIAPFLALETHCVGTWYVNALAVFPRRRGRGIGAALLAAAEEEGARRGHEQSSIQVYAQNLGAVRLYERLGYTMTHTEAVRIHPCQPYYTGDVLLMMKNLTSDHY